jgi:CrcB protein
MTTLDLAALDPAHVVGAGGAVGALLRHWVSEVVDVDAFPLGTLTVNVGGSFLLALVTFGGLEGQLALLVGTGLCGSFTTYSSFSFETVRLYETGERARAVANALGTLVACLLAAGIAIVLV